MRSKPTILTLALAAFLAVPLLADEAKGKTPVPPAAPAADAAMKVHVDPATGQLVPRAAVAPKSALTPAPAAALPPLKVESVKTKAGGLKMRLDDRYMMQMAVSSRPDGKVTSSCVAEGDKGTNPATERRHDR